MIGWFTRNGIAANFLMILILVAGGFVAHDASSTRGHSGPQLGRHQYSHGLSRRHRQRH